MTDNLSSLSAQQLADVFGVAASTLFSLVNRCGMPRLQKTGAARFDLQAVSDWLKSAPPLAPRQDPLERVKESFRLQFPDAIASIKTLDKELAEKKRGKGYSLLKVPSKKFGFLYYVRYIADGKLVPSKWCAHTNDRSEAALFALDNRERLLSAYFHRRGSATPHAKKSMYALLEEYYAKDSPFLKEDKARGRSLCEKTRSVYRHFVTDTLIPHLKAAGVSRFDSLTPPVMAELQNSLLLKKGNKPATVNRYFSALNVTLAHYVMKGFVKENVLDKVKPLKTVGRSVRGCHEIGKVGGVFNSRWEDEASYMLCLMIYATGMRNGEIARLRPSDVVEKGGERFVSVSKSKTKNGERLAPLHGFVYGRLADYIKENDIQEDEYIFSAKGYNQSTVYRKANAALGAKLGCAAAELDERRVTYYSGRHYWKTLMSAGNLGEDAEELFMGHKVSREVRKVYNHKDKRGEEKTLEKAREVFAILDGALFLGNPPE
jgi:integrase/predicted DNA-binding transcriptional regulator AlpA